MNDNYENACQAIDEFNKLTSGDELIVGIMNSPRAIFKKWNLINYVFNNCAGLTDIENKKEIIIKQLGLYK